MEKGDVSITAIVFIVCGIAVLIFAGALAFRVPGLFGKLLGYIQTGLIAVGSTLLDFLMKIFGKYFSAFATALGVTLNVVIPVLVLQTAWPFLSSIWSALTTKGATFAGRLSEIAMILKSGLSRQFLSTAAKNIFKTAGLMFFVSLGAELMFAHFGIPQAIDNLNLPGQGFTIGGFSWSWGSAITSFASTGLGLAAVSMAFGPPGWIVGGIILVGSFFIGGFIH
ncbi:MAG: hypothetical protein ACP5O8_02435 [Candidatus Aenigmatarchaeota archaeon]